MSFADRLITARKARGLTQVELAKSVGVTQKAISLLEQGVAKSSSSTVQLAIALNIEPLWLAAGKGRMESNHFLSDDEQDLLDDYRRSSKSGKDAIRSTAGALAIKTTDEAV